MIDPYKKLGVNPNTKFEEIKAAHRKLVKKYHPDAGGDEEKIKVLNEAWKQIKDNYKSNKEAYINKQNIYSYDNINGNEKINFPKKENKKNKKEEIDSELWLKNVYLPSDKILSKIIRYTPKKIKELSADPYDDKLMESFCDFIEDSKKNIDKISKKYQEVNPPKTIFDLALDFYHCFSMVKDALHEYELYTYGYVDNYIHDGNQMMKKANQTLKEMRRKKTNLSWS